MLINDSMTFGDRRLVGQQKAREQVQRMLQSNRLSHAYLLTGPAGVGKTAFALTMAEIINGVDHLTDLKGTAVSKKSSWFTHPDIHLFIPLPSKVGANELKTRLKMLADDPYEIVDFTLRPALTDAESSKNRQSFYSIDYYREDIRPVTVYKPNEGRKVVVIMSGIDRMPPITANAFLKLLEEPSGNIVFILTASNTDQLLPTIISRCQQIRLNPLSADEITAGLVRFDDKLQEDARFLASISDGNYAITRFFDADSLRQTREEIIRFLRFSYMQDVAALLNIIKKWNSGLSREKQIALCNTMESFLRDLMAYRATEMEELVTNKDRLDVIRKFCSSMTDARLEDMIEELQSLKELLFQNVTLKYIFTALSLRFAYLMRGQDPVIPSGEKWRHVPAVS
jgi:DNA polymerase III subunit delta'